MTESNTRASLSSSSSSFGAMNSASSTGCWCFVVFERYRSWILYSLSFVIVSLAAGIVYGWPALRHQLLVDENGSTLSEEQCGLIYTIGAWSTQGGRFFAGIARDKYGTKYITCVALCSVMLGLIGVGLSDPNDLVVLCLSFFFIGLGSAAQLCVQPVSLFSLLRLPRIHLLTSLPCLTFLEFCFRLLVYSPTIPVSFLVPYRVPFNYRAWFF